MRGDVSGVADGEGVIIGRITELLANFKRRGLLTLQSHRID